MIIASNIRKLFLYSVALNGKNWRGGMQGKERHILTMSDLNCHMIAMLNLYPKATIFSIQTKHSSILVSDIIDYQK